MPEQNRKPPGKDNKFLFDLHVFDEDGADLNAVPDEPPPPMFAMDEVSAAKEVAYAEGKKAGLAEAAASREQKIVQTIDRIAQNFSKLFSAEQMREKIYEKESIHLVLMAIDKMFPTLNEKLGQEDMSEALSQIVRNVSGEAEIIIEVAPDAVEDIRALLARQWPEGEKGPAFTVKGREQLGSGACALSWQDGGAVRDPAALAEKMREQILALLPAEKVPESAPDASKNENTEVPAGENNGINEDEPAESGDEP